MLLITEPFLKLPTLAFLKNILCILREFYTCTAMSFDGIHDPLTPSGPHIASSSKFLTSSWVVLLKCRHIIFVTVGLLVILAVFFDSVIDVTLYKFFQSLLKIKLLGSLLQKDFVHNRSLGLLSVVFVLFLF